jgi:hypothetical protein
MNTLNLLDKGGNEVSSLDRAKCSAIKWLWMKENCKWEFSINSILTKILLKIQKKYTFVFVYAYNTIYTYTIA